MSEQSMKCKDCVLKHIANAMSYAKEILAGHGIGGTPDHRPDYLGELVNAENHLEHISIELLNRVMVLRTAAQTRRMLPVESEIDELRQIWIDVEKTEVPDGIVAVGHLQTSFSTSTVTNVVPQKTEPTQPIKFDTFPGIDEMEKIGVILDDVWYLSENEEKLNTFYKLSNKYMKNGEIVFLQELKDGSYEGKYVWVFPFNVFIAKETDMKIPVTAAISDKASSIMRLVKTEDFKKVYKENLDQTACEVVDKLDLSPLPETKEDMIVLGVYRKPCCSVKSRLNTARFIKVNDEGWPYMKEIWEVI